MRNDMRIGDGVLFYHSSCAVPGIYGLAEVASDPYPDETQFDPESPYYDEKSRRDRPRWYLVDVKLVRKTRPLPLAEMRQTPAIASMQAMRKRDIRILPGGDYGFAWTPHGTNARDLEYFVRHVGMSTMEALLSATAWGGPMMKQGKDIGYLREGCLADILLIDGDPLADITILQDKARILAVMKDGEFHRAPPVREGSGSAYLREIRPINRWAA